MPTATSTPQVSHICSRDTYNCCDFSSQAEVQAVYDYCMADVGYDMHNLDGKDEDSIPYNNAGCPYNDPPELALLFAPNLPLTYNH